MTHDPVEEALAARVVNALLREDYGGLSRHVQWCGAGLALTLPGTGLGPRRMLPLERDGFLADYRVAPGAAVTLADVRSAVAVLAGARDADGAATFDAECHRALAEARLRARDEDTQAPDPDHADWTGPAGQLRYDALAAALPHPAYPASPCRLGLDDADLLAYAPEFRPEFELRWAAVPRQAVTRPDDDAVGQPAWWPNPAQVGLPAELAATHELFPVHPLTARDRLPQLLREYESTLPGLAPLLAPEPYLTVRPTLSVRTVALADRPAEHLKLPLPASTLGARNRRSLKPGTLADGELVCRLLTKIRDKDPHLSGLLLADDTGYAHAGHPDLGYLHRCLPLGLDQSRIVPVAALTAPITPIAPIAPTGRGRLVVEELANQTALDVLTLTSCYFRLVLGVAVRLLVRYGIALESHQQNAALVTAPRARPRLLVKDFDGTLVNLDRLRAALPGAAPDAGDFDDPRMLTTSDDELADVFVTITLHLCVGALAFALAERGAAPLDTLLAQARRALNDALDTESTGSTGSAEAAGRLRARVLGATRLTGKSMITAGTLTAKEHTGATDINKFYGTTGPNYLKETR